MWVCRWEVPLTQACIRVNGGCVQPLDYSMEVGRKKRFSLCPVLFMKQKQTLLFFGFVSVYSCPVFMIRFSTDVIWVILSVEVGGLLGVTQQLSSFETEFNTQPQRSVQEDFNPFASPQKNKHDATDDSFRDPEEAWERTQEPIQQDQNGLSHTAVNRTSNGLQTNLSMVTYGQVCMHKQVVFIRCDYLWSSFSQTVLEISCLCFTSTRIHV